VGHLDSRRLDCRVGVSLFSGALTVLETDRLVDHPGSYHLSAAPTNCPTSRWQTEARFNSARKYSEVMQRVATAAQFLTPSRGAGNLQSVVMTVLALGYEIMKHWVAATPESASAKSPAEPVKAQVASAAKARDDPIPRVLVKTLCLCGE